MHLSTSCSGRWQVASDPLSTRPNSIEVISGPTRRKLADAVLLLLLCIATVMNTHYCSYYHYLDLMALKHRDCGGMTKRMFVKVFSNDDVCRGNEKKISAFTTREEAVTTERMKSR